MGEIQGPEASAVCGVYSNMRLEAFPFTATVLPAPRQVPGTRVHISDLISVWASQVALVVKNPPANARDTEDAGLIPWSGRSPREGNGNPLQYSCLENSMNKGARGLQSMGSQESDTTEATEHARVQ